ncbi:MAG: UvrD-helicase domain-containing protein [Oscillospiraceae bacterium]|nr:UvrD-helicase domain-containing protein [Oscillospiraceae bacterium]
MTENMESRYLKARKAYIESQFQSLNPMQQQAVMATEGPLLLLAGAGSGKTTVLIHRIANLMRFGRASDSNEIPDFITEEDVAYLENLPKDLSPYETHRTDFLCAVEPAKPWSILAITFTNKAAGELKQRLESMLGESARDIWAMTFHAACCRILRKHIELLGYTGSFTIYDSDDSERVMKGIIKDMGLDDKTFPARYVLSVISKEKDKLVSPQDLLAYAENHSELKLLQVAKAYKTYQAKLKENNALDFDDIILLTVRLLQENEDVRTYYQRKFRYVLVDEYQDTNHLQYLLTSLLAGGYDNICVVGDDDQSIYRFRGATIENILDFEKQYKGSRVIRLEQNYRSTQSILNAANAIIAHNVGRKGKKLWTSNGTGTPITLYEASDEGAEANYIASQIFKSKSYRDNAILYRTNAQSNALEYAFKRNGIPYRIIGGTRFFDRAEIKDMLAYLCVIHNRNDDLRLRRIVNNPPRGLGPKALETATRLATASNLPLYSVLSDPYSYASLEKPAGKMKAFCAIIEELAALLEDGMMTLPEFYDEVLYRTGYETMLKSKDTLENESRLENVRELKSSIQAYVQNAEIPTLGGFLEEIALYTDIEEYDENDDAVVMMTMHASKGLEFPNVYLVGFEDGLFPGMRSIGDREEMEEERRLCYVAITRAKKTLTISYAKQRMLYGKTNANLPSRFIRELPEDEIVRKGGVYTPSQSRTSGFSDFSQFAAWNTPASYSTPKTAPRYQQAEKASYLELNKGDMVQHTAFGRGMVISAIKMGNDALLEIAFDQIGTKRLMAKTASIHMKKLS